MANFFFKYFFDDNKHTTTVATIYTEQLASLRALRLWHWQQAMKARRGEQRATKSAFGINGRYYEARAIAHERNVNLHLKAVQTLNDFFPAGDTAERDAAQ